MSEAFETVIAQVLDAPTDRFTHLIEVAGLDPARDLRHADLRNVDFVGCVLSGYDFRGARLMGATFANARINGAISTQRYTKAEYLRAPLTTPMSRSLEAPKQVKPVPPHSA